MTHQNDPVSLSRLGRFALGAGNRLFASRVSGAVVVVLLFLSTVTCDDDPVDLQESCLVTSDSVAMGVVQLGSSSEQSFTITASGSAALTGTVAKATGSECDDFAIIDGSGDFSLPPAASRTVRVMFTPSSIGIARCTIDVGNSRCPNVSLVGRGDTPAECHVDSTRLDFGRAFAGDPPTQMSFSISNAGGDTLRGTVALDTCEAFSITSGNGPYTLTAGQTHQVTVSFDGGSSTSGVKNCVVSTGCADVELTGERFPGWVNGHVDTWPDVPDATTLLRDVTFGSQDIWLAVGYSYEFNYGPVGGVLFGSVRGYTSWWFENEDVGVAPEAIAISGLHGIIVGRYGSVLTLHIDTSDVEYPFWLVERNVATARSFYDVSMADNQTAIAVGDSGAVITTQDGGANWALESAGSAALHGVEMLSGTTAIAVGESGALLRTTDGGQLWEQLVLSNLDFYGIDFLDSQTGTIVGQAGGVYRTSDGGDTWTKLSIPTSADLYDVSFADANNGVIVATEGYAGAIWRSFDAGDTWIEEQFPAPHFSLYSVTLLNPTMGMITGDHILLKVE
jgi:photosystem II stability/assembly factor-like uncharacterized protein